MNGEQWAVIWDTLCDRFGREPDNPDLATLYLEELEARLSDDEIERGVRAVVYSNTYFPSPKEIVDAASQAADVDERAVEQTEVVRRMMKDWRRAEPEERLDECGRRALDAVGGIKELALLPRDKADWRLKEFRRQYAALASGAERRREALPPMTYEGRRLVEEAVAGELPADGERP